MIRIAQPQAQRFVLLLAGAVRAVLLYPGSHPAVVQQFTHLGDHVAELLRAYPEVRIGVIDGVFFCENHLFFTPTAAEEELASLFTNRHVEAVAFRAGVTPLEIERFVELLTRREFLGERLVAEVQRAGIAAISVELGGSGATEVPSPGDEEHDPGATYREALHVVTGLFSEVEKGRLPSSDKLRGIVDRMATMIMQDRATLLGLAMIKDYDNYTFHHSVNVGILSMSLGAAAGLQRDELGELGMAGFLHDVGKTRVEKAILNKPGRLSSDEYERMKRHSEEGARIVDEMPGVGERIARAVLGHHIRFDRAGYPESARALAFDRFCDIIAVADCYDAITTLRVYKSPLNPKDALLKLRSLAGSHLDSGLVQAFTEMMGRFPVGTLVRLDTNEVAVVFRPDPSAGDRPAVKVVADPSGRLLEPAPVRDLARETGTRIVAVVDPLMTVIDVNRYLG